MAMSADLTVDIRHAAEQSESTDAFLTKVELILAPVLGTSYLWFGNCKGPETTSFDTRSFDNFIPGLHGTFKRASHPIWTTVHSGKNIWLGSLEEISSFAPDWISEWTAVMDCKQAFVISTNDSNFLIGFGSTTESLTSEDCQAIELIAQLSQAINQHPERTQTIKSLATLTIRQRLILDFVARGWSNSKIASEIGIAPSTVSHELGEVFRTLCVENRSQAIKLIGIASLNEVG